MEGFYHASIASVRDSGLLMSALAYFADSSRTSPEVREVPQPVVSRYSTELFDHLVGARQQHRRNFEAERLGGLEIDHQLEFRGLIDREVLGLGTFENLRHVVGAAAVHGREIDAIGHEPARLYIAPVDKHSRHSMLNS